MCCANGKIQLTILPEPPQPLKNLLNDTSPDSKHFLQNIQRYNSSFQMTSFGSNIITEGGFMPTFKVQGQVYHRIGSLLPLQNEDSQYLQIYFVGVQQNQAQRRCKEQGLTLPSICKKYCIYQTVISKVSSQL